MSKFSSRTWEQAVEKIWRRMIRSRFAKTDSKLKLGKNIVRNRYRIGDNKLKRWSNFTRFDATLTVKVSKR